MSGKAAPILNAMPVELTEALLAKAAGWDVMKLARAYLAQRFDRIRSVRAVDDDLAKGRRRGKGRE